MQSTNYSNQNQPVFERTRNSVEIARPEIFTSKHSFITLETVQSATVFFFFLSVPYFHYVHTLYPHAWELFRFVATVYFPTYPGSNSMPASKSIKGGKNHAIYIYRIHREAVHKDIVDK